MELFMDHILAENTFHESCRVNRTQDYCCKTYEPFLSLNLQIWCLLLARCSLTLDRQIECRFTLKLLNDMATYSQVYTKLFDIVIISKTYPRFPTSSFIELKMRNWKDETINWFTLVPEKHFVKLCNTRNFGLSCSVQMYHFKKWINNK